MLAHEVTWLSPLIALDLRAFFAIYGGDAHARWALGAMIALTVVGSGWSLLLLAPLFARARTRRLAGSLLGTFAVTALVVFVLKMVVGRARPFVALTGVRALFDAPHDFSFPSGHAAGGFAFAGFVLTLALAAPERRARHAALAGAALALAAGIAASRVYLGCHFPADAAGGAVIGLALGALGARLHGSRGLRDAKVQRDV